MACVWHWNWNQTNNNEKGRKKTDWETIGIKKKPKRNKMGKEDQNYISEHSKTESSTLRMFYMYVTIYVTNDIYL